MRICSLLPSITEILFELGLGDSVVGVTHECDFPQQAQSRVKLTDSRIQGEGRSSAEIDEQVRGQAGSLYELDAHALAQLKPDIIFTQSLCPVCAVDETTVRRVATTLSSQPKVVSYHPTCLSEIFDMIEEIGRLTGATGAAQKLTERFHSEIKNLQVAPLRGMPTAPRVMCLEWTNPPFACGHWTPELVSLAGGTEVLGKAGQPSRRVEWQDVITADPQVLLIAPCGFTLSRTQQELIWLEQQPSWANITAVRDGRVFVTDGSAYFNRPGPRLVESLQILAEVIHPERFKGLAPPDSIQQVTT